MTPTSLSLPWPDLLQSSTSCFGFATKGVMPGKRPGMTRQVVTLLQRLQRIVFRLRPAGACAGIVVQRQRRLAERLAVDLDHGLAELTKLIGKLEFGGADLVRRLCARLLQTRDSVICPVSMICDCTS